MLERLHPTEMRGKARSRLPRQLVCFACFDLQRKLKSPLTGAEREMGGAKGPSFLKSLKPEQLKQFEVSGRDEGFDAALATGAVPGSGVISVKAANGVTSKSSGAQLNGKKEGKAKKRLRQ